MRSTLYSKQGSCRKRLFFQTSLLLLCIGLTACSGRYEVPPEATDATTPADSITYIWSNQSSTPLSYIEGGTQRLWGEWMPASSPFETVLADAPGAESIKQVPLPDCYNNSDSTRNWGPIASNGDWDFFPEDVSHVSFGLDNQPEQEEWQTYFRQKLDLADIDSPVIITETYSFSWNGHETAVVTASNLLPSDSPDAQTDRLQSSSLPGNNSPGVYIISALFIPEAEPVELFSQYDNIPKGQKEAAHEGVAYVPEDVNYNGLIQPIPDIQYDEYGNTSIFFIYCNHGGELTMRGYQHLPKFLVADINGDHELELVMDVDRSSSTMSYTVVYQMKDDTLDRVLYVGG